MYRTLKSPPTASEPTKNSNPGWRLQPPPEVAEATTPVTGIMFVLCLLILTSITRAQSGTTHVGLINLKLIITNMQETIDARREAVDMQAKLNALGTTHQGVLKDLQEKLSKITDHQSADYQHTLDDLDQKSEEFSRDEQAQQINLARFQNRHLQQAFDEINQLVADQAKAKGLDLVMLDNSNDLPENHVGIPTIEALENSFLIRTVAYKSDQIDFSNQLIALLNKSYKAPTGLPATPALPMTSMSIGRTSFQLEIASDDASRARGLMERDTLAADHGMIFVFDHASNQTFWMHHTRFSLDIIFADEHGKVVSVHTMKAYDEHTTFSDAPAKYAIELPAGAAAATGVKPGDTLQIPPAVDAALKK